MFPDLFPLRKKAEGLILIAVGGDLVGRGDELSRLRESLDRARENLTAMILDGQAGIGKTTLSRALVETAHAAGFRVLSSSGAPTEVSLAWTALADLLAGVDDSVLAGLPALHQQALRAVNSGQAPGGDERLVASAFRGAVDAQSRRGPVLVVVDDAQWLDEPSRLALGFAVRRLTGPVAVLAAFRDGEPGSRDRSWLKPPDPRSLSTVSLGPMGADDLRAVLAVRVGGQLDRASTDRIYELSGGNPFYAVELGRAAVQSGGHSTLPETLAGLLRARIGAMDSVTEAALVTVACAFEPTVATVAGALGCGTAELVALLEPLESRGVLLFDGARIRFSHPLIASAVINESSPAARRKAHASLATTVVNPEQQARHLALSTPHGDSATLAALDGAADDAVRRGAFSTAAELTCLAIERGGDNWLRRLRGADFLFRAGSLDSADRLIVPILDELPPGFLRAVGLLLAAAIRGYRDGLTSTIGMLQLAVREAGDDIALRTQALLVLALSTGIGGDMATCVRLAREARAGAEDSGVPSLRSQALTMWSHVSFMYGLGTDSEAIKAALRLADSDHTAPIMLRPKPIRALNLAWTGNLEQALVDLNGVRDECSERGNELDALWADEQLTMVYTGLGRYADAERVATDAVQRAEQIGGRLPSITAQTALANAFAHRGRVGETRSAAELAIEQATAAELNYLVRPPTMSLAFVLVSDGRYEEALQTLKPLLEAFDPAHDIEIVAGRYLPDAVEALTALGRVDEAEPLVAALAAGGARHDRAWMLATAARCRALIAAARGDLDGALESAEEALAHHERLPMPFELARTLLLSGQLQRRRRRLTAARAALMQAAEIFDAIGSPLWADRTHRELTRLGGGSTAGPLTESEQEIAGRAAAGLSNKEIAAELFLSTKTVEMHLSNAYRKLGIRSRSQLAGRLRAD